MTRFRTRRVRGTPEMNATSFLLEATRTPMCHSLWKPGGVKALRYTVNAKYSMDLETEPSQELGRVLESEGGVVVLYIVERQETVDFLVLQIG